MISTGTCNLIPHVGVVGGEGGNGLVLTTNMYAALICPYRTQLVDQLKYWKERALEKVTNNVLPRVEILIVILWSNNY
jgi:hypothetical protein